MLNVQVEKVRFGPVFQRSTKLVITPQYLLWVVAGTIISVSLHILTNSIEAALTTLPDTGIGPFIFAVASLANFSVGIALTSIAAWHIQNKNWSSSSQIRGLNSITGVRQIIGRWARKSVVIYGLVFLLSVPLLLSFIIFIVPGVLVLASLLCVVPIAAVEDIGIKKIMRQAYTYSQMGFLAFCGLGLVGVLLSIVFAVFGMMFISSQMTIWGLVGFNNMQIIAPIHFSVLLIFGTIINATHMQVLQKKGVLTANEVIEDVFS